MHGRGASITMEVELKELREEIGGAGEVLERGHQG